VDRSSGTAWFEAFWFPNLPARFEPNSGPTRCPRLPCISQHHMPCDARAGVVHSYIRNVPQVSRAVCEIPAQNVGILRQSGRWSGKTHAQRNALSRQRSTMRRRAQGQGQIPHAVDLHCRDGWGRLPAGGPFPAAPLATDGCPGRVDRTATRRPSRTPGVVAVGFGGLGEMCVGKSAVK
jgi:hypothetical protein